MSRRDTAGCCPARSGTTPVLFCAPWLALGNSGDLHVGEQLPVPACPPVCLAAFLLEHDDFGSPPLGHDLAGDLRLGDNGRDRGTGDRKSTRLNSSHGYISYAVFCLKKKKKKTQQ